MIVRQLTDILMKVFIRLFLTMKSQSLIFNYFLLLFGVIALNLVSCKEGFQEDSSLTADPFTIIEQLSAFVENVDPTAEEFKHYASNLDGYLSAEEQDSILCVSFKEGYTVSYDYYGKALIKGTDDYQIDTAGITHLVDSLYGQYLGNSVNSSIRKTQRIHTRAVAIDFVYLKKRKVLIWTPWSSDPDPNLLYKNGQEFIDIINKLNHDKNCLVKLSVDGPKTELSDIKKFNSYDMVICITHGTKNGELLLPIDMIERGLNLFREDSDFRKSFYISRVKKGEKPVNSMKLTEKVMNDLLPSDLSKTIIWTLMCYAGIPNSAFFKACKSKNVADFYGADNFIYGNSVIKEFESFMPRLLQCYSTIKAYNALKGGHLHSEGNSHYFYRRLGDNSTIVAYRVGIPIEAKRIQRTVNSITRASDAETDTYSLSFKFVFPTGTISSIDEVDHGIALYDSSTGQTSYIPVDSKTLDYYSFIEFDDVTVFDIGLFASSLKPDCEYMFGMYEIGLNGEINEYGDKIAFRTDADDLRQKLIQFYYDTDGPNWTHNENWCSDKPLEEWYGIVPDVYDHNCVQISLESNGLSGDGSLAGCELITYLNVMDNQLTSLDVSGCSAIRLMYCMDNQLTNLDVSRCSSMTTLVCYGNQLESLNVSGCSSLTGLSCGNNKLTHLDISECSSLLTLYCGANLFTSLDFSKHPTLQKIECYDSYSLTSLNVSGCCSLVELECGFGSPWGGEPSHGPLLNLNVTGCTGLTSLTCHGGSLTDLNLSGCYALKELWCNDNYLQSLDISDCKSLYVINCASNQLSSISLSGYTELKTLYICYNSFTNLSLRGCTSLEHLECYNNDLRTLDLSGCISLSGLSCDHNHLSSLDLSDSSNIEHVFADNNNLVSINLRNRKHLKYLWCNYNNITDLDVSECPLLESFQIFGNRQLKSLALNGCSSIKSLDCSSLSLQNLGILNCSSLETLRCENNNLTSLNTEGCSSLRNLSCQNNSITQQIPSLFKQLYTFVHDQKYLYYYDDNGNLTYSVNEAGWYYPGEPEKGYHGL